MAAAFAALPCKVLWRLTPKEVPNAAAIAALGLGNNTQVLASTALAYIACCSLAAYVNPSSQMNPTLFKKAVRRSTNMY